MSDQRRITKDRYMDSCYFFKLCWNIPHYRSLHLSLSLSLSFFLSSLFVFVCMCVPPLTCSACDGSESSQWKWPSSCYFSLSLSLHVHLPVRLCCSSSNCACDGTWAQSTEMTGRGYCLFQSFSFLFFSSLFYAIAFFHALLDLWLVHRSAHQGTSIDQVKHLNEALSSFFFVFLWMWWSVKITARACGT